MRKTSVISILCVLFIVLLSSCSYEYDVDNNTEIYSNNSETPKYNVTEIDSNAHIYVDTETNVMYWCNLQSYGNDISVMLNADGTPKLYTPLSDYTITEIGSDANIFVDVETNVMYWYAMEEYGIGLTVMLNADGTPKLYKSSSKYRATNSDYLNANIYIDGETNIMYWYLKKGYGAGLTVMLNPNGSPKVYDPSSKYNVTKIDYLNSDIYIDEESNVMYWHIGCSYRTNAALPQMKSSGGLTVMLDTDGTPKIYNSNTKYNIHKIDLKDYFYVDTEANVMYWYSKYSRGGGLTVMFNIDGTSKLVD